MSAMISDFFRFEWSAGELYTIHCTETQSDYGHAENSGHHSRDKSQGAVPEGIVLTL